MEEVQMDLKRIIITETGEQQVIILKEKFGERQFPILIGTHEAVAIDRRLRGITTARPLTHDLMSGIITSLHGTLEKIVVSDLHDHTFFAKLHIRQNGTMIEVDSRPSDAIALGVANNTPIYVADHVLKEVS